MIELKNINKIYKTGKIFYQALHDVSLTIEQGDFVAIMGPSGSGKSTLLHLLGFLDKPDTGSYAIYGKEIAALNEEQLARLRNHLAGFVFQQFHLLARTTALDNVHLPQIYSGERQPEKTDAHDRLKDVGLAHRENHKPNEMSGGEQQRVAIARALVNDPLIVFADEPTGNLDTKSEEEIIRILKELNRLGKTIIMVTHEKEIAEQARRIILMRDGRIVSDERKDKGNVIISSPHDAGIQRKKIEEVLNQEEMFGAGLYDHFQQAVRVTVSHKVRAFLSVLGILIGVSAVIAMLALGEGAKIAIQTRLASLGSNLLMIRPGSSKIGGVALEAGSVTRMTLKDAEAMSHLPSIKRVSSNATGRGQVTFGNKNWNTRLEGVGINYESMKAATPILGRFFNEDEMRSRAKVAVLGLTVARELFGEEDPIGAEIKINRINFEVIGILPEKGSGGFRDQDDVIVIPLSTAMYRVLGKNYIDSIDAEVVSAEAINQAQDEVYELMAKRQNQSGDSIKDNIDVRNMADLQKTLMSTTKTMGMLLGFIAVISLIVGGIGIMNIMLVSVTERTKEIGLRKAIGATEKDIMTQFLIESIVLTLIGGLMGVTLGVGSAFLLSLVAGWTIKVSLSAVFMALAFSIGIGLIFGLWPASRASKLNPIDALRSE